MCREQHRKRWQNEYLKEWRERYQDSGQTLPDIGHILLIADDNNPKSNWKPRRIINVIKVKDSVIQGYKTQNNKGYTIERLLQ